MSLKWKGWFTGLLLSGACLLVVGLLSSCAPSAPAPKGGKSCLDCHEEYRARYSDGIVHAPVAKGDCAGCHRTHGLIGGAYLKAPVPNICFFCHKELKEELRQAKVMHLPVEEGQCSLCHQPHNAPEKFLLEGKRNDICFNCHDPAPFQRAYQHPPLAKGCETCHTTHSSVADKLLIKDETALCQDCHRLGSSSFIKQHGGYEVTSGCSDCHNVHSAENQNMLKDLVHIPVAERDCQSCHQPSDSAKPFAVRAAADQLCRDCHAAELKSYQATGAHEPAMSGACTSCHQVHASNHTGMVKKKPQQLCFDCHKFNSFGPEAQAEGAGYQHAPVEQGDCLICHAPHLPASGQPALLRKPGDQLCLDCHAEYAANRPVNHQPARSADCLGCHLPHESLHEGVLKKPQRQLCADCHDVVSETLTMPSLHRPFVAGNCAACHNPHGAERSKLLTQTGAENCGSCHRTLDTERQQVNRHAPFKEGRCELCHLPHGSEQPFLLTGSAGALCVECHSGQRIRPETPTAHQNCAVCHHAHGNDEPVYLLQEQPQLCLSCHEVDRFWAKGVGHQPAVEGDCQACHDPHAPQLSRAPRADATLCGNCHDVSRSSLASAHSNILPSSDSCLSCHDPHGGPDRSLTLPVKHEPFAQGNCTPCHAGGQK